MNLSRSTATVLIAFVAVSLAAVYWMFSDFAMERDRLLEATARLEECQASVQEIDRLNQKPRVAALVADTAGDINRRINTACEVSGLVAKNVVNLALPEEAGSEYSRRNTTLIIEAATLAKLVLFAQAIEDTEAGLSIKSLKLTPSSPRTTTEEQWTANLTLTQLIFSPKS